MLHENDPQVSCESALEEVRCQVEDFPENRLRSRILKRIEELEVMLEKYFERQSARATYDFD